MYVNEPQNSTTIQNTGIDTLKIGRINNFYTAQILDQFNHIMPLSSGATWSIDIGSDGTINPNTGTFSAPDDIGSNTSQTSTIRASPSAASLSPKIFSLKPKLIRSPTTRLTTHQLSRKLVAVLLDQVLFTCMDKPKMMDPNLLSPTLGKQLNRHPQMLQLLIQPMEQMPGAICSSISRSQAITRFLLQ